MTTAIEIKKLSAELRGRVILPKDLEYDEARTIYNAMIDKRPALFVKCKDKYDVTKSIHFAKKNNLEVSVKAGGHNGAGLSLVDNGLVIDLSEMKGIDINLDKNIAIVEPGNTLSDVDKATHEHGLAIPVGVNGNTGISGLTLGGGLGFLTRKAGLTIDHLLEAEVVLASGEVITVNVNNYADLYWALRGGGGNFGVVVSFTYNLLPIANVYAGPMLWPMTKAREVMRFFDNHLKQASNDLYGFFAFLTVPDSDPFPEHLRKNTVCGVVWCYTGDFEKAEQVFGPIREFEPPILDFVSEMPLPALNSLFDWLYPPGLHWYWKGHYLNELSEEAIAKNIEYGSNLPTSLSSMHLYPIDGKAHEINEKETAWAHRNTRWVQVIVGVTDDSKNNEKIKDWSKAYYDEMLPFSNGGGYVNFMMQEEDSRIKESYGVNYNRLRKIKQKYDPENFFHLNQNIKPENS